MDTYSPYPADTEWTFRSLQGGHEHATPLLLSWEVNGDPITDDFTPDEITAEELWNRWFSEIGKKGEAKIYWFVMGSGTFEGAPFARHNPIGEDFLTYFSWPLRAGTGERLNFLRLPVRDKLWNEKRGDKGGFIQQHTGWKPSPLQPFLDAETIAKAAGLNGF
ncbi:hypothetical protein [Streptomyces erythrochromogenes]|uniref:hypothetical protein n=1 Tax=Streptomyces erythrochromogenes TaxID=285574 RepID=UPI0036FA7382